MALAKARTANKVFAKARLTEVIEQLCIYQLLCLYLADVFQIPCLRKYPKRYRKPYDDSANIKMIDMKRTFGNNLTKQLTDKQTGNASFLISFFCQRTNILIQFFGNAQNTLSFFPQPTNPTQKKNERVFSPTL
ncbi:MAG: hypothetical protein IPM48_10000 [Saprospiraceae bacterium]|nr:hypothetical protein [Saprospiraceae bacterium]